MQKQQTTESLPYWDGPLSHPFYSHVVKRILDLLLALILMIPGALIMLPLALWVKLDSKGPVFYKAPRGGYHNRTFQILKFRSMVVGADKTGGCTALNDSRVTRAGKVMRRLKLDELPQLLNILMGDMSVVGPRPPLPDEVEQYSKSDRQRLLVTPGLTCFWQASTDRNDISFARWMELDRKYIAERSVGVDLKLILKTVYVIFRHHDGR